MDTINYLHNTLGIVHRDLKPENMIIQINKQGLPNIKVIDFGLSDYKPIKGQINSYLTDYVGTPSYAAPEIINKEPYDEEVDIWSLGVLLYNMLTGLEPFSGKYSSELNEQIILKQIKFDIITNESMRNLCKKFLERDADKRINALDALNEIRNIKSDLDKKIEFYERQENNKNTNNSNNNNYVDDNFKKEYYYYKVFTESIQTSIPFY